MHVTKRCSGTGRLPEHRTSKKSCTWTKWTILNTWMSSKEPHSWITLMTFSKVRQLKHNITLSSYGTLLFLKAAGMEPLLAQLHHIVLCVLWHPAGAISCDVDDSVLCPLCHAGYLRIDDGIARCPHSHFNLDLRPFQLSLRDLKQRLAHVHEVQALLFCLSVLLCVG